MKNEVVFSLNRQVDHQLQAATDPFELDRGASPNYTAAPWTIRDPIPTQFALTLFTLSGRPRVL